jgi:hypothetical protein
LTLSSLLARPRGWYSMLQSHGEAGFSAGSRARDRWSRLATNKQWLAGNRAGSATQGQGKLLAERGSARIATAVSYGHPAICPAAVYHPTALASPPNNASEVSSVMDCFFAYFFAVRVFEVRGEEQSQTPAVLAYSHVGFAVPATLAFECGP